MAQTPQKRSRQRGYEVEKQFEKKLQRLFPSIQRTGSLNYYKNAPDLTTEDRSVVAQCKGNKSSYLGTLWSSLATAAPEAGVRLVCTQDKHGKYLVTFEMEELVEWIGRVVHSSFEEGVQYGG